MNIHKLLFDNNISLPFSLGEEIGRGADGQLFNYQDKVLKLSIIFDYPYAPYEKEYERIKSVLSYLINRVPSTYARVSEFGDIFRGKREEQRFIVFYSLIEKCFPLSEDERKVFHSLVSHEDAGRRKNYSLIEAINISFALSKGLDFNIEKVILFLFRLSINNEIRHNDICPRNIMKNKFGDFVLIDFDRVSCIQ
jgi:hypothetical protein